VYIVTWRRARQVRFAYYMRGHHVFRLAVHVVERPQSGAGAAAPCHPRNVRTFTDHWSQVMSTAGRPAAANWTTVSVPLPPTLRCRYLLSPSASVAILSDLPQNSGQTPDRATILVNPNLDPNS